MEIENLLDLLSQVLEAHLRTIRSARLSCLSPKLWIQLAPDTISWYRMDMCDSDSILSGYALRASSVYILWYGASGAKHEWTTDRLSSD